MIGELSQNKMKKINNNHSKTVNNNSQVTAIDMQKKIQYYLSFVTPQNKKIQELSGEEIQMIYQEVSQKLQDSQKLTQEEESQEEKESRCKKAKNNYEKVRRLIHEEEIRETIKKPPFDTKG